MKPTKLKAGAAQVDITPKPGTQLAGDIGRRRPLEQVIDPLYAGALVLEGDGRKLCLVSLDLTAVTTECADEIRRQAAEELGCSRDAVMVHDTQNHAAPALGHFMLSDQTPYVPPELSWLRGGDDEYIPYATRQIVEAVHEANAGLQPVRVGAASGIEARVAFNRRFVMRNGRVSTHPAPGSPLIRHVEGPIDPELGVVCFLSDDPSTRNTPALTGAEKSPPITALLLHYTCHPCHGYPFRHTIGDWPGVWRQEMQGTVGGVPLVLNGCCGNIHHTNHLDPTQVDDYREMGRILAETTYAVMRDMKFESEAVLDWRSMTIPIPFRLPSSEEMDAARSLLASHPQPRWTDETRKAVDWQWFFAAALLDQADQRERAPEFTCEIQAFRIGNTVLVALPGEPFVEGQLRIKIESPAYPTYVAHHCNVSTNYIPTPQAFTGGGYEVDSCYAARLVPEALDTIVDTAGALLRELFEPEADCLRQECASAG